MRYNYRPFAAVTRVRIPLGSLIANRSALAKDLQSISEQSTAINGPGRRAVLPFQGST
jgi:hypothetical protein